MLIFPPSTKSKGFANMVELQEDTGVETDRNNKDSFSNGISNNIMSKVEVDVDF